MASGGTTQIVNLYTGGTGVLVKYVESSSTQIINLYTGGIGALVRYVENGSTQFINLYSGGIGTLVKYTESGSTQYINLYTGGSGVVTAAPYQPVGSLIAGVSILPIGVGVGTTQISGGSVSYVNVLDTVTNYKYAVTEFNDSVDTAPVMHGSKLSQLNFVDQVAITADVNGVHASSYSFNDTMTVVGSYSGYKLGTGTVVSTVVLNVSGEGTKSVNSNAYGTVLTYGQVLGVKPVSGSSTDTVSISSNGFTGSKQVAGNAQSNVEVQVSLSWHKQSYGEMLSLTLVNQSGLGYKVNKASFNKLIIVNAYGEGEAYFKINLACLTSKYSLVTVLVPKYLINVTLLPTIVSDTILITKCVTLAIVQSSKVIPQVTLNSRILACQRNCI